MKEKKKKTLSKRGNRKEINEIRHNMARILICRHPSHHGIGFFSYVSAFLLVHFLLLVHTELSWSHVDEKEETATKVVHRVSFKDSNMHILIRIEIATLTQ